ncbi:hypothetical protein J4G33_04300 [Actinotalea sp. BY-33]|uniref:Uncharacterized protein n=1 Tax=Actinotalea soli TaxID=2819234 RepID=A0A939LNV8_9CELL|nr:hypothetical protein [Actinotalea soli]MBO1751018.1 hypothetical protein [Actinotalea soli]
MSAPAREATSRTLSPRLLTGALIGLAVGGGALIWSIASYSPDTCFAILPPFRACNPDLRQYWASFWILTLALVGVLGVIGANLERHRHRAWVVLVAEGILIASACLAVRP